MRYIVSHCRGTAIDRSTGEARVIPIEKNLNTQPDDGSPVIPSFPTGGKDTFMGVACGKENHYARVDEIDVSLNSLRDTLLLQYPGLTEKLIKTYLMESALLASKLPVGTVLKASSTYDTTYLIEVANETQHVLWTQQPV